MISDKESRDLINKLFELRKIYHQTNDKKDKMNLENHERHCVEKFKYIVTMRTSRYKSFSNYDDLNQEGLEALIKAMKNYNPSLGSFFWWAHRYIDTRIARSANLHTTIRYPLRVAKEIVPHKESAIPNIYHDSDCPDFILETSQIQHEIKKHIDSLPQEQKNIVNSIYGFNGEKPMSINKLCQTLNISRVNCMKALECALSTIKANIKL